jgi:hypothetical protein
MHIAHLGRKAALALAVPMLGFGLIAGTTSAFAGQPKPPPPVVKVFPATPVYPYISCVAADAAENAIVADLKADLATVEWQEAHAYGPVKAWFAADVKGLEAQIAAVKITPCPILGYRCPRGTEQITVDTLTWPNGKHAKPVVVVTHDCVVEQVHQDK